MLARRQPREPDEGDLVRQAKLVVRSSCRPDDLDPTPAGEPPEWQALEVLSTGQAATESLVLPGEASLEPVRGG